mgnify:CR=1 FL=1
MSNSNIVEQLCKTPVSKSFVSKWSAELDPMVNEWRNRSLKDIYFPYNLTDVVYIKVREKNRVVSKSFHIAIGINNDGYREMIDLMIQDGNSESS